MNRLLYSFLLVAAVAVALTGATCNAPTIYKIIPYLRCVVCGGYNETPRGRVCNSYNFTFDVKNCNAASVTLTSACNRVLAVTAPSPSSAPSVIPAGYNANFFNTTIPGIYPNGNYTITTSAGSAIAKFKRALVGSTATWVDTVLVADNCAGAVYPQYTVCPPV